MRRNLTKYEQNFSKQQFDRTVGKKNVSPSQQHPIIQNGHP